MSFKLREEQAECLMSVQDAWARGVQRPACILPTGWGKTITFCTLAVIEESTYGRRPLIVVHRQELVDQTVATLRKLARPGQRVGIIKAGVDQSRESEIVVASIQTLSRKSRLHKINPDRFDLLIMDEAHATSDNDSGRRVLEYFGALDGKTQAVGFTATMTKVGKHGLNELWPETVFRRDLHDVIQQGFLVPVRALRVTIQELDTRKVKISKGDFSEGDLAKALSDAKAGPIIAAAYNEHARTFDGELRRGILFCPTVDVARSFAADFVDAGIPTEVVVGETPNEERRRIYDATRRGENIVIASVSVLVEGFDLPAIEVAVMARPTKAIGRYIQGVGRALRLSPDTGKTEALILDVVGATRLGLVCAPEIDIEHDNEPKPLKEPLPPGLRRPPEENPDAPDDIGWIEVDPYAGLRKEVQLRKGQRSPWRMLRPDLHYLVPDQSDKAWVFITQEDTGWSVGRKPQRGRAERIASGLAFPEAVQRAYQVHPRGKSAPAKLQGYITEGQIDYLARLGITENVGGMTKEEAGEAITARLAELALG